MGLNSNLFQMDRQLLEVSLRQLGERSNRELLQLMRDEARNIQELAREYAPVDDGYLQDAIEVVEDRTGINGRTEITVQVDPGAQDDRGESVAMYGLLVHELLGPFGSGAWKLGKNSRAKDGGSGVVGGKYLERAVIARRSVIGRRVNQIARKIFS